MKKRHPKKEIKVKSLLFDSYLAAIRNSVGTNLFRHFYAEINGKTKDVARNGIRSCAFFVSSILTIFDLLDEVHMTINRVVEEMEKSGWHKIKKPREGAVLIWEKQKYGNERFGHIGFYIGGNKAISNSTSARVPKRHHWTFGGKRKVEAIYWHRKLKKSK